MGLYVDGYVVPVPKKHIAPYRKLARKDRDRINGSVMADPRLERMTDPKNPRFDARRMFWGGFKERVAL